MSNRSSAITCALNEHCVSAILRTWSRVDDYAWQPTIEEVRKNSKGLPLCGSTHLVQRIDRCASNLGGCTQEFHVGAFHTRAKWWIPARRDVILRPKQAHLAKIRRQNAHIMTVSARRLGGRGVTCACKTSTKTSSNCAAFDVVRESASASMSMPTCGRIARVVSRSACRRCVRVTLTTWPAPHSAAPSVSTPPPQPRSTTTRSRMSPKDSAVCTIRAAMCGLVGYCSSATFGVSNASTPSRRLSKARSFIAVGVVRAIDVAGALKASVMLARQGKQPSPLEHGRRDLCVDCSCFSPGSKPLLGHDVAH